MPGDRVLSSVDLPLEFPAASRDLRQARGCGRPSVRESGRERESTRAQPNVFGLSPAGVDSPQRFSYENAPGPL